MKTIIKKALIIMLCAMCIAIVATLSACSVTDNQVATQYGQENAYDKSSNGHMLHLRYDTISFYIPPTVTGEYRMLAEYAVRMANTLTSQITVNITDSPESNFSFSVVTEDVNYPDVNAMNYRSVRTDTGEIVKSKIQFVSGKLDGKSLNYKKQVALHEMLHTFGLGHVESNKMIGRIVMIAPHPEQERHQLVNYTDFDRANVVWKYGK